MNSRSALLLLMAAALALAPLACRQEDQDPDDQNGNPHPGIEGPETMEGAPGPIFAIAGIRGFRSISTVRFADAPNQPPYRLTAVYEFPGRTAWTVEIPGSPLPTATREYRYGDHQFLQRSTDDASIRLEGEERIFSLARMQLRLGAMMAPDAPEWRRVEGGWEATLTDRVDDLPIGSLRVAAPGLADSGDARGAATFELLDERGAPLEALVVHAWREDFGRVWPAEMTWRARNGDAGLVDIWTEVLDDVDTRVRYEDEFFLPVDRRRDSGERERVHSTSLPPTVQRLVPAPEGIGKDDWDAWLRAASESARAMEPELNAAGYELDTTPGFVLDKNAEPLSILLRLRATDTAELPDGWSRTPGRRARSVFLDDLDSLDPTWITGLRGPIPASSVGAPYVRVWEDQVQLVQPIE